MSLRDPSALPSPGARADARLPAALAPGYVLPEERGLVEHLARLARLAEGVPFCDPEAGAAGSWARLFEHEPAAAMAEILALRPEAERRRREALMAEGPEGAAAEVVRLAARLDAWCGRLARGGVREAEAALAAAGLGSEAVRRLARVEAPAAAGVLAVMGEAAVSDAAGDALARARGARAALVAAHERLLGGIASMRPHLEAAFAARLSSGQLDPAFGLIVAELRLLAEAEARINRFTARHADFYQRDVLGQAPLAPQAETVLLRIEPTPAGAEVPAGTRAVARPPGATAPRVYVIEEGLRVAPAEVGAAFTLRYERDPLISPQSELGYVTAVRASPLRIDDAAVAQGMFAPESDRPARLGLDLASPMLWLAQGRRRIELRLAMARRQETGAGGIAAAVAADPELAELFGLGAVEDAVPVLAAWVAEVPEDGRAGLHHALLRRAASADQLRGVLGRIVAAVLVEGAPWPEGAAREVLEAQAAALLDAEGATAVRALVGRRREEAFRVALRDAFEIELSSAVGPLACGNVKVAPLAEGAGIAFTIVLEETQPAIVAPAGEAAPVLSLRTAAEARFCPVSLFEPFLLEAVEIETVVEGLTDLVAFTDDGPVDVAQPFLPFGVRPADGATLLVGAREMALKPVTEVGVSLAFSDLPRNAGGFGEYYRAYGPGFAVPAPRLALSYLTGEGWKALGEPVAMFVAAAPEAPLRPERRIEASVPGRPEPARLAPGQDPFRQRQSIRSGMLRLRLGIGPDGFGHGEYPAALARALRPRPMARAQRPVPPLPFTPQIGRVALDYAARAKIVMSAPAAARPGERVVQAGPFGATEIFPARTRPGAGLFPPRLADGVLFLHLAGPGAGGRLSLAFEMAPGSHRRTAFEPKPLAWHYLTAGGWQPLPGECLDSDSTEGLMRSGIVALDLPDDAATGSGEMPGRGAWVAVAARAHLDDFPRIAAVTTNGARARRLDPDAAGPGPAEGTASWSLDPPPLGAGAVRQLGPALGGAPAEALPEFRARVAERLRHRGRVLTAWDAERLVLSAFPQVWQAKCLPGIGPDGARATGALTLVAVPMPPEDAAARPAGAAMFDVLALRRIEAYLAERASPFARIIVRNPSFERLQVRAKIALGAGDDGALVQRLKLDLSRALSVWTAEGAIGSFGWTLRLADLGALIAGLDYVDFLTDFSILHLVADDAGRWRLHDTARDGPGGRGLSAAEPWSLALPMRDHWIGTVRDRRARPPHPAGIGGLGIGETLVVGSGGEP